MDDPIFKLEKVVQTRGDEPLEDFEGPLDLILYLLGKNKIEIQDIPIALILEQYQDYLEKRKQMDLEVASEFITMAAQLMFIKTRMLLNLDGTVTMQCGETEIGQGADTAYAQMTADIVGLKSYKDVHVVSCQDTDITTWKFSLCSTRSTCLPPTP